MDKATKKLLLASLDAPDAALLPYIPYLLQDLDDLGSFTDEAVRLVSENLQSPWRLSVLDAACGKGRIAVHLAREFGCRVMGVDLMPAFIESARRYAAASGAAHLCSFKEADAKAVLRGSEKFDLVVFTAGGDILGPPEDTLRLLRRAATLDGYILLGGGFCDADAATAGEIYTRSYWNRAFYRAGLEVCGSLETPKEIFMQRCDQELEFIKKRAAELSLMYPERAELFESYVHSQSNAEDLLSGDFTAAAWLLKLCDL